MVPLFHLFVQFIPRTSRSVQLPCPQQYVILLNISHFNPFRNQVFASSDLSLRWLVSIEIPNESNSYASDVVPERVSPLGLPTPSFVGFAITPNEEIVADVPPAATFDVVHLDVADVEDALGLRRTVLGCCVVDYNVWHGGVKGCSWFDGGLREPLEARNDLQFMGEGQVFYWRYW